jgi:hypothetical protein
MRSWRADYLWRDFLEFCAARVPDDVLARQFAHVVTSDMDEPVRSLRAAGVLIVLQTRLAGPPRAIP